jgi:AraC-like DNA-binding protein/mannose-6-phosphate isomerase-like protein (cupin superfamily)
MKETIAEGFKGERAIVIPANVRAWQAANPITKQLYVTHMGYYPKARYHYRTREKGAAEYIFIYCEKGKGWIDCFDERIWLKENTFFIIPAGQKHAYGADRDDPWSIYWLHFHGENVGMFSSITGRPVCLEQSDTSRHADRIRLFDEMYRNLEMGYSPENLEHISFCLMYFFSTMKYLPQYRELRQIREDDTIQRSILFMKDHLEERITLDDLACAAGYSSSQLNALFVQRVSCSPMEYYNQLRIQRGCSYLQFSKLKIKEIAFRLNYYDPFHFSNAFRREMGITPKAYRNRYRDQPPASL